MDPRERVLEMLGEHYSGENAPFLQVSRLGSWMSEHGITAGEGISLSNWISSVLAPEYTLIIDSSVPARRVIVPSDRANAVRAGWVHESLRNNSSDDSSSEILAAFPRSVLVAFHTVPAKESDRVFLRFIPPPPRYLVAPDAPDGQGWHEISKQFRPDSHCFFRGVDKLTPNGRRELLTRIQTWFTSKGISISEAFPAGKQVSALSKSSVRPPQTSPSALERLLAAQPSEYRRHFMVPGDIAEILLRHR